MPSGFLTEDGLRPEFVELYGPSNCRPQTVRPGPGATPDGLTRPSDVAAWILAEEIRVLNVAGNRESTAAGIGERAERFPMAVFRRLAEG